MKNLLYRLADHSHTGIPGILLQYKFQIDVNLNKYVEVNCQSVLVLVGYGLNILVN